LAGDATVRYYDYLEDFGEFPGIMGNLTTEICMSKERDFDCVDLIDSPGLVDGDMQVSQRFEHVVAQCFIFLLLSFLPCHPTPLLYSLYCVCMKTSFALECIASHSWSQIQNCCPDVLTLPEVP
jgi:hypothetical protein